jgi:hypothetical protein
MPDGPPFAQWAPPAAAPAPATGPSPAPTRVGQQLAAVGALAVVGVAIATLGAALGALVVADIGDVVQSAEGVGADRLSFVVDDLEGLGDEYATATGVSAFGTLLAAVGWILWQRRFVVNAAAFAPITPSKGWGSWGWIVPVANLFMPQSQLANAARVTDPIRVRSERSGAAPTVLILWWVAYSASLFASIIASFSRPSGYGTVTAEDFDAIANSFKWSVISSWSMVLAGFLGIATVLVCTARQRRMLGALGVRV